jgi:AraC-like DNA-binding protein
MHARYESAVYFRQKELPWIELCRVECDAPSWATVGAGLELIVPTSARARIVCGRSEFAVDPGSMFCAAPGRAYRVQIMAPGGLEVLAIDPDAAHQHLVHDTLRRLRLPTIVPVARATRTLLTNLYRLLETKGQGAEHLPAALNALLASVLESSSRFAMHTDDAVSIDRLRVPLEDLAGEADRFQDQLNRPGINRFQAARRFKQRYGLPPKMYELCMRIALAKRSLKAGHSPSEVAAAQAFSDQSHFTKHFKCAVGATPREYALASHGPRPLAKGRS